MAITTQLLGALGGGRAATAVTVPNLAGGQTYEWGQSGKTYFVAPTGGRGASLSGDMWVSSSSAFGGVVSGPLTFSYSVRNYTFLCMEVGTN